MMATELYGTLYRVRMPQGDGPKPTFVWDPQQEERLAVAVSKHWHLVATSGEFAQVVPLAEIQQGVSDGQRMLIASTPAAEGEGEKEVYLEWQPD